MNRPVARAQFAAMTTTVGIVGVEVADREIERAVSAGQRLAEDWEARFSRFRADSQLSRLNAAGGATVPLDRPFLDVLAIAWAGVRATDGRFDPSILPALEAHGYDRSFPLIASGAQGYDRTVPGFGARGWAEVRIDRQRGEARLPAGMRIDLGGVAKGAFVDRLAAEIADWPGGCVDAGGDLRVWGHPPSGDAWLIGIEDPAAPDRDALTVRVLPGTSVGFATSGIHRRQWRTGGTDAHHLIDPRSGSPTSGAVLGATAMARTVATAEIATKALIVAAAAEPGPPGCFGAWNALVFWADGRIDLLNEDQKRGLEESHDVIPRSAARPSGSAA